MIQLKEQGVYTITDFLSPAECTTYRELVFHPPTTATNFTNTGIFTNKKWEDPALATTFYEKLTQYVEPSPLAIRANTLIMTGNYTPGQEFSLHTDTGLFYDRAAKEKSRWTLLIYLNDDFEGGHTLFYHDDWKQTHDIRPVPGTALLFDIDLWHKGDIIKSGTKQWIGCEIIGVF